MDEDLLTQRANGPEMDMDMGGGLQYADPAVVGLPELEPDVPAMERVSGMTATL